MPISRVNQQSLVFVHLSDIHFRRDYSETPRDLESDLRDRIEEDAMGIQQAFGAVDRILITGDTVFGGTEEEYTIAKGWLTQYCDRLGVQPAECIRCVPGNHDVEWAVIDTSKTLRDQIAHLKAQTPDSIDDEINAILSDSELEKIIYKPIANYNLFAASFDCNIDAKRPNC